MLAADDKVWDQNAFNDLFRRGINYALLRSPDRTFLCAFLLLPTLCNMLLVGSRNRQALPGVPA